MPSNHPYHRKTVINTPLKEQIISEYILQEKKIIQYYTDTNQYFSIQLKQIYHYFQIKFSLKYFYHKFTNKTI